MPRPRYSTRTATMPADDWSRPATDGAVGSGARSDGPDQPLGPVGGGAGVERDDDLGLLRPGREGRQEQANRGRAGRGRSFFTTAGVGLVGPRVTTQSGLRCFCCVRLKRVHGRITIRA